MAPSHQGPDVSIRLALQEDFSAIARIYAHHVDTGIATFEEVAPDEAEMQRRWGVIKSQEMPWLVACGAQGVLGYAYAGLFHARSAYRFTVEDSIYLSPEAQGQGVGSLLLESLIRECKNAGKRQMMAVIGNSENHGSIGLHRKFGFRDVGIAQNIGFKFGKWVDVVYMQLDLTDRVP